MSTIRTVGAALLTANCVLSSAWGAGCVGPDDMSALRTAALQQELMVAALSCHAVDNYNQFVLSHQADLIDSDNRLKTFFVRRDARSGEASYHTFKTELANDASLRSIRETRSFCADAADAFDLAARPVSLAAFVASQPLSVGASWRTCPEEGRSMPTLTQASAFQPVRRDTSPDGDEPTGAADHESQNRDADDQDDDDR
jgi:hypothetical protein